MPKINEGEILRRLESLAAARPSADAVSRVMERTRQTVMELERSAEGTPPQRGAILKPAVKHVLKVAVAAVVVIGILVGVLYVDNKSSVVWADVPGLIAQKQMFEFRQRDLQTANGSITETERTVYISADLGIRIDTFDGRELISQSYTLPQEKMFYYIRPAEKQFAMSPLSAAGEAGFDQIENSMPEKLIERYLATGYEELDDSTINGVEAEGIAVYDANVVEGLPGSVESFAASLWVSKETSLPIRLECEALLQTAEGEVEIETTLDQFKWDIELGPEVFEPNIPEDYVLVETDAADPNAAQASENDEQSE